MKNKSKEKFFTAKDVQEFLAKNGIVWDGTAYDSRFNKDEGLVTDKNIKNSFFLNLSFSDGTHDDVYAVYVNSYELRILAAWEENKVDENSNVVKSFKEDWIEYLLSKGDEKYAQKIYDRADDEIIETIKDYSDIHENLARRAKSEGLTDEQVEADKLELKNRREQAVSKLEYLKNLASEYIREKE